MSADDEDFGRREDLFQQIDRALITHSDAEEEIHTDLAIATGDARARRSDDSRSGWHMATRFCCRHWRGQSCWSSAIVGGSITSADFCASVQYPSSARIFP